MKKDFGMNISSSNKENAASILNMKETESAPTVGHEICFTDDTSSKLEAKDWLSFKDSKKYKDRLSEAQSKLMKRKQ